MKIDGEGLEGVIAPGEGLDVLQVLFGVAGIVSDYLTTPPVSLFAAAEFLSQVPGLGGTGFIMAVILDDITSVLSKCPLFCEKNQGGAAIR